ncbi:hypothetical protein AAG906_025844 [Vitis piasezkii]
MALEATAVETVVTDVYRDGRSLLSWSGHHEDLMQKARELWELSNGIREGISQNRIKLDAAKWIVKVEMNESEVIELDTKYNDRKNHPWKLFCFGRVLVLAKTWQRSATKFIVFGKRKIRCSEFSRGSENKKNRNLGNGGNRKTTIIEHLNTHDNINKMFDMVIRVTVPKEWSVVGFQQKIMDWLQLNMGNEVCHPIELENIIGIHNIKNCKVVLASRDLGICWEMDVDEAINVKPLSSDEALNMFKEKVGKCINNFPRVIKVAQVVVKECGGLPLLIDKLAKTFKSFGEGYSALEGCTEKFKEWMKYCFLKDKSVKMNKVLREMALKISQQREDSKFLAKPREGLKEPPNPEEWKQVYRISLMDNELHSLPEALDCCDLVTLLLQRNKNLVAIPEVLYLNSCIHLVGLPTDIEALKQLEGSQTQNQSGNVSSFVSLEEFSIDIDSSLRWWAGNGNIITEEFFVNSNLAWKDFFVRTSPAWEDLSFTFQFVVGYNCLKFINGEGINPVISKVLAKTHAFGLINHKGVSRLSDFGIENMNDLFICSIEGCNEIETIINGTGITKVCLNICTGPVYAGSLTHLRTLVLLRCPQLKKIFSNGMIQQLSKLEDLRVEECDQIEEIIMKSENNGLESNQVPRLKTLTLLNLPRLRSIWRIEISMCHMLKRLPFNNANATKLRCIEGQQAWWEALEWMDDGAVKEIRVSLHPQLALRIYVQQFHFKDDCEWLLPRHKFECGIQIHVLV